MLAVLTMWPSPCSTRAGRKARTPWITPHRFTPSTHSQGSVGPNHGSDRLDTPALLHTTCTAPNRWRAAAARARTEASSLTSVGTTSVSTPGRRTCSAAVASAASSTSASTTWSPEAAKRFAKARPIPLAAPVTTATFPGSNSIPLPLPPPTPGPVSVLVDDDPADVAAGEQVVDGVVDLADGVAA